MQVGDEYRSMAGVIGQSKKLITKYARREFTDKVGGKPNQVSPFYCITHIFRFLSSLPSPSSLQWYYIF